MASNIHAKLVAPRSRLALRLAGMTMEGASFEVAWSGLPLVACRLVQFSKAVTARAAAAKNVETSNIFSTMW
ncbi:hypothetical protein ACP90_10840 [Labrenzia sp. CP4]|nr:hypothetical protein ACP90_10840 [Labrenzia sp. CP4]